MDVKSSFLNGYPKEEVYFKKTPGVKDHELLNHVLKLDKALYVLMQAPRAWYERLLKFLLENFFKRGKTENTLFLNSSGMEILISQVYRDDKIFIATSDPHSKGLISLMGSEIQMSMIGELIFFLGFQSDSFFLSLLLS